MKSICLKVLFLLMLLGINICVNAEELSQISKEKLIEQLPEYFIYSSGVGAWSNDLTINIDGSFNGQYHDSNPGNAANGYAKGQIYLCVYEGELSSFKEISKTIYEMDVLYYKTREIAGKSEIIDEFRYDYSVPYGLEDAHTLILYLPGTSISELPEIARYSCLWRYDEKATNLKENQYILYNENENICFFGLNNDIDTIATESFASEAINDRDSEYILPDVSSRLYSKEEIINLTQQDIYYAQNEIFAIHGKLFKSEELQNFFNSKSWYKGEVNSISFDESLLNEFERSNLELLQEREKELK